MPNGPANRKHCPRVILKGSAYQRGLQYGRTFRKYLPRFYDWFVRKPVQQVLTPSYRRILERLEAITNRHYPQIFDELKGWSDGARMPYDACRLLAFHNDIRPLLSPGCSNAMTTKGPEGPWLARSCDLFESEREWQVLKICFCDDSLSYAATGYLGIPGVLGMNSAGLAVGGSSIGSSARPAIGLANLSLVLMATCRNVKDCGELVRKAPPTGKGAALAILDAGGHGGVIEYAPGIAAFRRPDTTGFLAATNFSVTGQIPHSPGAKAFRPNSMARYDHLTRLIGKTPIFSRTMALAKQAFADHEGEHHVCQHIPDGYHTIYSWIIQPRKNVIHFNWGYPCQRRYERISIDWKKRTIR